MSYSTLHGQTHTLAQWKTGYIALAGGDDATRPAGPHAGLYAHSYNSAGKPYHRTSSKACNKSKSLMQSFLRPKKINNVSQAFFSENDVGGQLYKQLMMLIRQYFNAILETQ